MGGLYAHDVMGGQPFDKSPILERLVNDLDRRMEQTQIILEEEGRGCEMDAVGRRFHVHRLSF